jgi:hypothetical protein
MLLQTLLVPPLLSIVVLYYYVSLCSGFRVVMSVTISALKRCSVRLYFQLFIGALLSYFCYLYLFVIVSNTYCVVFCVVLVFVLCLVCSMLPVYLDCLFLNAPSVFSNVYLVAILR